MDFFDKLHDSDGENSSAVSLRDLPLDTHGVASHHSPPSDVSDFSFPVPTEAAEPCTASTEIVPHRHLFSWNFAPTPKLSPFGLRRAESLDWNYRGRGGDARTGGYQLLRRARTDPRPTPAGRRWKRWSLFVLGLMKFPAEMEIKDIRSRQMRKGLPEAADRSGQRSCWRVLQALSCKAAESTAVSPLRVTGGAPVNSPFRMIVNGFKP